MLKRFENQEPEECGEIVGIDDFAFKKRNTYDTIIVDEKSHSTIAILDGRDGKTLRQWLKGNQHIKAITRDRASAYAKAISEELPNVMQVADRFHLHQNLLDAVKGALNRTVPANIKVVHDRGHKPDELRNELFKGGMPTIVPASSNAAAMLKEAEPQLHAMGLPIDINGGADTIQTSFYPNGLNGQVVNAEKKIYPNDLCPCGSGKKYKKCCGKFKQV